MPSVAAAYMLHDDAAFLAASIASFKTACPVYAFVSKVPWTGEPGDWDVTRQIAEDAGATVIVGDWRSEAEARAAISATLLEEGFSHALIPDGDEIIEARLLSALLAVAQNDLADRVYVEWDTYWKGPDYVIRPREPFSPLILINLSVAQHQHCRDFSGGRRIVLDASHGIIHHLSYAGPDERIQRKITTWGHRNEVVEEWWDRVWKAWDHDPLLRNLHPTHPEAYAFAERIPVPEALKNVPTELASRHCEDGTRPEGWPKISVIIPLYGGVEDIRLCLESLGRIRHLLHEVIVVDNASPDGAADVAESFDFVTCIRNEENRGFGPGSNQGIEASDGEVLLFLNSDAIVPVGALEPLIWSLLGSTNRGAVAPLTNFACTEQAIQPTYTSLENLDRFAQSIRETPREDLDVDFIIGFCLAIRRATVKEVSEPGYAGLAFDPRFTIGGSEDCDLCYRLRRAGFRVLISGGSYVHHHGSQSFARTPTANQVIKANDERYRAKWARDLETGFASHLTGQARSRIVFNEDKRPETIMRQASQLSKKVGISLCMIVRNEERVIRQCLESALPYFSQIIIVDTGSTDATKEICREFPEVTLIESSWQDSFSVARNESLKYATQPWIIWIDADDIVPFLTGKIWVEAVYNAPRHVKAFVTGVQFVEPDGMGTRVDHVKVFRNLPGVEFEGRIHEQVLPSLNKYPGDVISLDCVVLHAGYDNSPQGQKRKLERDYHLLKLELADRPDHPYVHFCWGMTEHHAGNFGAAVEWLRKSIELGGDQLSFSRKAYVLWSQSFECLGELEPALQVCFKGRDAVGEDPELYYQTGKVHARRGEVDLALRELEMATKCPTTGKYNSVDIGIRGSKTFLLMSDVCANAERYEEAKKWGFRAIESGPRSTVALEHLFATAIRFYDGSTARDVSEQALRAFGPTEMWANMRADLAEAFGGADFAIEELVRIGRAFHWETAPRIVLCRRLIQYQRLSELGTHAQYLADRGNAEAAYYVGRLLFDTGDLEGARRAFQRSDELNPGHPETTKYLLELSGGTGTQ